MGCVAVDEHEKHLQKNVVEWLKEFPSAEHGTNLAEVGTDCISRQAAIKATWQDTGYTDPFNVMTAIRDRIEQLPSVEPQIIRCKDCKHHLTHKCMDSMPIERCDLEQTFYDAEVDYCSLAERREDG